MSGQLRLYMLGCGTLRCRKQSVFLGADDGEYEMPVTWHVLVHPEGVVVVDGGNPPQVVDDPVGHWGEVAHDFWPVVGHEERCLAQLERLGIEPASVTHVLQSHLHIDHTGAVACIDAFPDATVVATRAEHEWAHTRGRAPGAGYTLADFERPDVRWRLLDEDDDGWDVFGDGVIRCWLTPGHSAGHMSFEVTLPRDGTFVLAVDAAFTLEHWHGRALPGAMISEDDTRRSVEKLRRIAARADAVPVPGHDPVAWPGFRKAPAFYC